MSVNIALHKTAYQIGVYRNATADKAVDGLYDKDDKKYYYLNVCVHPNTSWHNNVSAEWWVDLEATYSIYKVTVWNTYNKGGYWRMNNFTVEVATSENKTKQSCGEYTKKEPVSRGGNFTFNCNNKQGRYVYVRRLTWAREKKYMTLCEVAVDGILMTKSTTTTIGSSTKTRTTTTTTTALDTTTTTTSTVTVASSETITPEMDQSISGKKTQTGSSAEQEERKESGAPASAGD
ncbi:hypothetical protein LSH36_2555g00001 [Paralvinella palmiformis]|uniref:Fucolectin tachylectin-4 pentraxin-1 domain-containing protein n=1 Tax=Paralvinella palmiformis TaxID=53620 RepID=A0AAD9MP72_9ANNE|nr:hypothetical protein LSH36_2555g00001 [Paralvinella palmiformis]